MNKKLNFSFMERERTDTEWLQETKTNLEDLVDWSDELPEEFIISNPKYHRHKFRGNWFQGVISNVKVVADICGDSQLWKDADTFGNRRGKKDKRTRTTHKEIEEADQLIKRALEKLKNND